MACQLLLSEGLEAQGLTSILLEASWTLIMEGYLFEITCKLNFRSRTCIWRLDGQCAVRESRSAGQKSVVVQTEGKRERERRKRRSRDWSKYINTQIPQIIHFGGTPPNKHKTPKSKPVPPL